MDKIRRIDSKEGFGWWNGLSYSHIMVCNLVIIGRVIMIVSSRLLNKNNKNNQINNKNNQINNKNNKVNNKNKINKDKNKINKDKNKINKDKNNN